MKKNFKYLLFTSFLSFMGCGSGSNNELSIDPSFTSYDNSSELSVIQKVTASNFGVVASDLSVNSNFDCQLGGDKTVTFNSSDSPEQHAEIEFSDCKVYTSIFFSNSCSLNNSTTTINGKTYYEPRGDGSFYLNGTLSFAGSLNGYCSYDATIEMNQITSGSFNHISWPTGSICGQTFADVQEHLTEQELCSTITL